MKKVIVFLLALAPLLVVLSLAVLGKLGPDPGDELILNFAHIAMSLLLIVLSLKPLSRITLFSESKKYSRMLGLFTFFYAFLHFLSYLAFEVGFEIARFQDDLLNRPYVYLGMAALTILFFMAVTSTKGWQKRLKRNWKRLHMLVYPAALIAVIHVLWVARSDVIWAVLYGSIFFLIVFCRFFNQFQKLTQKS